MSKFECNSCGGTFFDLLPDGAPYYHVCPFDVVEPAEFDATGKQTKPEKRTPREDIRDERAAPELTYQDGKAKVRKLVPGERALFTLEPATTTVVSEGKGRTKVG